MELQTGNGVNDRPTFGEGGAWPTLDAEVYLMVDAAMFDAVHAAAMRNRISRSAFVRRIVVDAIENDDGFTASQPNRNARGPMRPRGLNLNRVVAGKVERAVRDRLDTIARRRGETRAIFVERALLAALAPEASAEPATA